MQLHYFAHVTLNSAASAVAHIVSVVFRVLPHNNTAPLTMTMFVYDAQDVYREVVALCNANAAPEGRALRQHCLQLLSGSGRSTTNANAGASKGTTGTVHECD